MIIGDVLTDFHGKCGAAGMVDSSIHAVDLVDLAQSKSAWRVRADTQGAGGGVKLLSQ